jgi:hypothetical protein
VRNITSDREFTQSNVGQALFEGAVGAGAARFTPSARGPEAQRASAWLFNSARAGVSWSAAAVGTVITSGWSRLTSPTKYEAKATR